MRNRQATPHVQDGVDAEEAQALQAEGLDPDDPAVIAAIEPCPIGTFAQHLSHRTRPMGVRARVRAKAGIESVG